eukprot:CAMPEP_0170498802 /NCGR_PEP_ID=MMETSP0208-20121228/29046_1 /TAXON_ID=197538 /ORGANISM="Strombidium inclinatum, Strain S3" /LENGTH=58 /DNA_ID=CAMNT_0010776093 /DNA_START=139 /DNA_END=315 /DNA_ORIENTATION=+
MYVLEDLEPENRNARKIGGEVQTYRVFDIDPDRAGERSNEETLKKVIELFFTRVKNFL